MWALSMLQNIAKYVISFGKWIEEDQYLDAKGPIRLDTDTDITAFAFCIDPADFYSKYASSGLEKLNHLLHFFYLPTKHEF